MVSPDRELQLALDSRRKNSLYRQRKILQSPQGAQVRVDGRMCVGFSSNDYLGLANHPELIAAFKEAVNRYGVGSGASHLVSGHSTTHQALEEDLAEFTGRPRALVFSTGYMANVGTIRALSDSGDLVVQDQLNHASLLDGGFLSRAEFLRYPHSDLAAAEKLLSVHGDRRSLLATDGVFSMDGDLADIPALADIADRNGSWLMVDDAHGFGVLGENGKGIAEYYHLDTQRLPILVGTFGKAFGTFGAFVAGSDALIETLIQHSRTYIYTTALPPAVAAATRASLKLIAAEAWRRQHLKFLICRFQAGATQLGIPVLESITPIQAVIIGDNQNVMRISEFLLQAGFWVGAIRSPTVPLGSERLRITMNAGHSETDIDQLLDILVIALKNQG